MDLAKLKTVSADAGTSVTKEMLLVKSYDTGRAQVSLYVNNNKIVEAIAEDDEQEAYLEDLWPRRGRDSKAWFVGDDTGLQGKAYIKMDYASLFGVEESEKIPKMLANGFWNPGPIKDVLEFNPREDPKVLADKAENVLARLKEVRAKRADAAAGAPRGGRGGFSRM